MINLKEKHNLLITNTAINRINLIKNNEGKYQEYTRFRLLFGCGRAAASYHRFFRGLGAQEELIG